MYISNKFNLKESLKRCLNTRRKILDISQTVTALHAAGAFSCVEIVDSIYYGLLRKDDKNNTGQGGMCWIKTEPNNI